MKVNGNHVNETVIKLKFVLLVILFFSTSLGAQDLKVKKLQKLFHTEMTYQIEENSVTFETVYPISISDFEKFQSDVRDSVAIETIYYSIEEDRASLSYLKTNKKTRAHSSEREVNRAMFPLNRNVKKLYTKYENVPILCFMRIPRELKSVINNEITFDDRRIYYETNQEKRFKYSDTLISSTAHPIFHNHWSLSQFSNYTHDIPFVIAQVLPVLFKEYAPYNLTENQYKAYLKWKSKRLNSELKRNKINLQAELIPLFQTDTVEFTVKGTELYNQWQIKKSEYDEFVKYAYDSLVRETLFYELEEWEKSNKFIIHPQFYFCERALEFVEFDPSDKVENRKLFSLNYKTKIKTRKPEVNEILTRLKLKQQKSLKYTYKIIDLKNSIDKTAAFKMKSYRNQPWFQIDTITVEILPLIATDSNKPFIHQLSYEQAIAFYNWKYPISRATVNSSWKKYVFPTKEEFLKLQSNAAITIQDKSFKYINTTLKYKVRLY